MGGRVQQGRESAPDPVRQGETTRTTTRSRVTMMEPSTMWTRRTLVQTPRVHLGRHPEGDRPRHATGSPVVAGACSRWGVKEGSAPWSSPGGHGECGRGCGTCVIGEATPSDVCSSRSYSPAWCVCEADFPGTWDYSHTNTVGRGGPPRATSPSISAWRGLRPPRLGRAAARREAVIERWLSVVADSGKEMPRQWRDGGRAGSAEGRRWTVGSARGV